MTQQQIPGTPAIDANLYASDVGGLVAAVDELKMSVAPGMPVSVEWLSAAAVQTSSDPVTWEMRATARLRLMQDAPPEA